MENSFQTSFIPKKPVVTNSEVRTKGPISIFNVIAIIILVVAGVSAGGLYLYKNYLTSQKEVLSSSLVKVRNGFDGSTISELELYDKRVSYSKEILGKHIVLSPMFALLGEVTIPQIQYTKFSHKINGNVFSIKMSGTARDYRSIALQSEIFNTSKGGSFKNVIFSNLTKDISGRVNFEIEFNVDPALLSYEKNSLLEPAVVAPEPAVVEDSLPVDNATNELQ